ncbi:hypothetical protein G6F57_010851 [Rhizopus arrhizus]|uniref:Uncharacterized protein n=1 Tax=Rhizopus oryzae TaxID=64495 RepID=A0A9P6XAI8_RHIOR|nr:hypothetical protein G6F24_005679 [Rhizopus arrhizus]KAG1411779.1 hypothetical protein G6F58_008377 [Rhizopus delemar]KAG0772492.1 hypothetical protein G6F22_015698 [Rhizopus arrhizus]KAG0796030.1 hypothetical protein G6F21_001647 [Rhizopus arrhizus]KAG0817334.1 hypothetical protein G6F20_002484 [Rhizopus arrhizus]
MPLFKVYQQSQPEKERSNTICDDSNSTFELIFSRLLEALIFTSAIAITAYTYITGTLFNQKSSSLIVEGPRSSSPPPMIQKNAYDDNDMKRRRIQAWAEEQKLITPQTTKKRHSSCTLLNETKVQLPHMKRNKKRTQSLSCLATKEQQEEILSRMEERLQSLIQQGQQALLSPVK